MNELNSYFFLRLDLKIRVFYISHFTFKCVYNERQPSHHTVVSEFIPLVLLQLAFSVVISSGIINVFLILIVILTTAEYEIIIHRLLLASVVGVIVHVICPASVFTY